MPAHPLFVLFLTLLVFLPPSHAGCRSAPEVECDKTPFVPGHHLAGEGFNILKMDTTGASVVDVKNFIDGGKCTICENDLLEPSKDQKLPVSVTSWDINHRCWPKLRSRMLESSTEVLSRSSGSTSSRWKDALGLAELVPFSLAGSRSNTSSFAQERSKKDKYSYSSLQVKCDHYTFNLKRVPPLSKEFEDALKKLPITESADHSAYQQFLDTYGTHYFRYVEMGGEVKTTTAIGTCETAMKGVNASTVSNCLSEEASATVSGVTGSAVLENCKKESKKFGTTSISAAFQDRITEVYGGGGVNNILLSPGEKSNYKDWLKAIREVPGVLSYGLVPLHELVRDNPTLKSKLREAIAGYIKRSAVPLKCTTKCKQGKPNENCVCKCSLKNGEEKDCCPETPGGGIITITVIGATGLWGDYFGATDGYVKIKYGSELYTSGVVWNNNRPKWNHKAVYRTTDLPSRRSIRVEVWDKDHGPDDDLLGHAHIIPFTFTNKSYRLKHGSMFVSLSVDCLPGWTGPLCNQLNPEPETSS